DGRDEGEGARPAQRFSRRSRLRYAASGRLAILDTAVGGYGSVNLARRLSEVRDQHFRPMRWSVSFHLLHAKDRLPNGEPLITQQSTPEISFSVEYFPVENLVIEDWDAGIGLGISGKDA